MRSSILALLPTVRLGGFSVSQELPFSATGVSLFIKNPKTIYVDRETTETVPLFATLDSRDINTTTTSVVIYFTTDAKNSPLQLETLITGLKGLKNRIDFPGANQRTVNVRTNYEGDLLVNEVEYRFTRVA
jgi:hypothetical protein